MLRVSQSECLKEKSFPMRQRISSASPLRRWVQRKKGYVDSHEPAIGQLPVTTQPEAKQLHPQLTHYLSLDKSVGLLRTLREWQSAPPAFSSSIAFSS